MPNSADVSIGDQILASQYNALRDDIGLPDEAHGVNLAMNFPSIEFVTNAQPRWWNTAGTIASLWEQTSAGPFPRLLRISNPGAPVATDYIYQTHLHTKYLKDSNTKISVGVWFNLPANDTFTMILYDVGGATALATYTKLAVSGWEYAEIKNITIGTTSTQLRIRSDTKNVPGTIYWYIANPVISVGPRVLAFKPRGLVYREKFQGNVLNENPADTNWADVDFSAYLSSLAAKLHLGVDMTSSGATANGYLRPNGSSAAADGATQVVRVPASGLAAGEAIVLCDAAGVIEESVSHADVSVWKLSLKGYWEWE